VPLDKDFIHLPVKEQIILMRKWGCPSGEIADHFGILSSQVYYITQNEKVRLSKRYDHIDRYLNELRL